MDDESVHSSEHLYEDLDPNDIDYMKLLLFYEKFISTDDYYNLTFSETINLDLLLDHAKLLLMLHDIDTFLTFIYDNITLASSEQLIKLKNTFADCTIFLEEMEHHSLSLLIKSGLLYFYKLKYIMLVKLFCMNL